MAVVRKANSNLDNGTGAAGAVQRTQYQNLGTGTIRTGATGHGESLVDVEGYLMPLDRARGAALFLWGVAGGLAVQAVAGANGVTVLPGTALDALGRLVLLAPDGVAVVDQDVDAGQVQNVPTVPVPATGIALPTPSTAGDVVLTITWREVQGSSVLSSAPSLLHAPWLRLLPVGSFADVGEQVVLAQLTLDAAGTVTALVPGSRRLSGVPAGRVELRRTAPSGSGLAVGQAAAAELTADAAGNVALTLLSSGPPRPALRVDAATAGVTVTGPLTVAGPLVVSAPARFDGPLTAGAGVTLTGAGGRVYTTASGPDGAWRLRDDSAGADRLVVDAAGNVAVGGAVAQRVLHVEGSEVHSGGPGGGFSFADRKAPAFVDGPGAGERWVWYSHDGGAHLWSGTDRISVTASGEGGGLDVGRRMRVRQGGDNSAGIWLHQSGPDADRGFVGMADDQSLGLFGVPFGWGLTMDVTSGQLHAPARLAVDGGVVAGGVTLGVDGLVDYPWEYETVGVNRPEFNLRLQSPNSVFVHAQGGVRAGFSAAGLDVTGNLSLRGRLTVQADDPWLRLNQAGHYPNGVHTPWALSCGNLNVGGLNNWTSPGPGNAWFAGDVWVQGTVRLGAGDNPVYIGGNQTGNFIAFHDDLWFSDPQNGTIELKDAGGGWGKIRGNFLFPSSITCKDAVAPLGGEELDDLLAEALDAQLVWFRWQGEDDAGRRRLGVIAEEAPVHLVEEDRSNLSIPEYVAVLLGAVQTLHRKVRELEVRR